MPTETTELRIFVASPGDCDEERDIVRVVADAVTQALGPHLGVRARVDGWEAVAPDFGRPQDLINPLVDGCDLFLGLLGHRWGTPTGTHSSGFQEEFERVLERRSEGSDPQVAIFLREPPSAMLADPGRELRKVLQFKNQLRKEQLVLYRTFVDAADLERQLWPLMSKLLVAVARPDRGSEAQSAGTSEAEEERNVGLDEGELDEARLQIAQTAETFSRLVRGQPDGRRPDSDRFLLIALALNDDGGFLAAHVANRLYLRRDELVLSVGEHRLWIRSMFADIGRSTSSTSRVVPGWAMLQAAEKDVIALLDDPNDAVVVGALRVLFRLRSRGEELWTAPPSPVWKGESHSAVSKWVKLLRSPSVRRDAENYLALVGTADDDWLFREIVEQEDLPDVVMLRSALAGDLTDLATDVATKPYGPDWKATFIESRLPLADTEILTLLATGPRAPAALRAAAARELYERDEVSDDVLASMLSDSRLADEVFRWSSDGSSSLTTTRLLTAAAQLDKEVRDRYDLRHRIRAATLPVAELLNAFDSEERLAAWDALQWRTEPELCDLAREVFDEDAERIVAPLAQRPEWRAPKDLLPFIRERSRVGALRILVNQESVTPDDLARLRAEVARDSVYTKEDCVVWLARVATEEDLDVLLANLPSAVGVTAEVLTHAVIRIGGRAGARALLAHSDRIQAALAVEALGSDPLTGTDELRELLYSPEDSLRMVALDHLVLRLDEDALLSLLNEYPRERENYYYNVVCELDWLLFGPDQKRPAQ